MKNRTLAIDLLRGFIIVFMALDHASGMIARTHFSEFWGVDFKEYGTMAWWFTRTISHLCAPGFFLLMGMSIVLFSESRQKTNWTANQIRNYFMKRAGIILGCMFFLEFPAWGLSGFGSQVEGGNMIMPGGDTGEMAVPSTVLFGLAFSMFVSAFLWRLKHWHLLLITLSSFALSTFVIAQADPAASFPALLHLLVVPGKSSGVMVLYPLIPWLGITTLGMFLAKVLSQQGEQAYRLALYLGLGFITCFLALRFLEIGNFQKNPYTDFISFFTLIKYPPSLAFACITCGINLTLLYLFSKINAAKWLYPLQIFGQTAMFFYILHLYVYALMSLAFPLGARIEVMYVLWLVGLIPLYFACKRFLDFKRSRPQNSLWRMF